MTNQINPDTDLILDGYHLIFNLSEHPRFKNHQILNLFKLVRKLKTGGIKLQYDAAISETIVGTITFNSKLLFC